MQIVQTVTRPSMPQLPHRLVDPMAFSSATLRHFIPFAKSCLVRAVRSSTTTSWRTWIAPPLPLGEECMVAGADGYTAAGDTETTLTCVFDPEMQSMLLEGSTHSCQWAPCALSTLMPLSTESHECPNTVFLESCTTNCSYGNAAISGTAAFTVFAGDSEGALVSDPTVPHPTCRGESIVDTCRMFCAERYQALSNDTSTLTGSYNGSNNTINWEGEVPLRLRVTGDGFASSRVDFSECFTLNDRETSVVGRSVNDMKAGDKNTTPIGRSLDNTKLDPSERRALTQRTVKGLRCSTCERMSRTRSHRPSRLLTDGERFNEELLVDLCDLGRHAWKQIRVARGS